MLTTSDILVAMVNYRTPKLCVEAVASLMGVESPPRVTIVDNASGDGSAQAIREAIESRGWGERVTLIESGVNAGFAAGNNIAIRDAIDSKDPPKVVWLLNPDTICPPGWDRLVIETLEAHPKAGIIGTRLVGVDARDQASAHRFPSALAELVDAAQTGWVTRALAKYAVSFGTPEEAVRCDWVSGASMLIRETVFRQIGLMDEGFFLYFEEVDFCRRARRDGVRIWHDPRLSVVHLEGEATGIHTPGRPRPRYWFESRRRYHLKHRGAFGLLLVDACWLLGRAIRISRNIVGKGREREPQPSSLTRDLILGDLAHLTKR